MKGISRRNFLRYLGIGSLGFLARPLFPFAPKGRGFRASDVVQCFDENATTGSTINESVVQIMMDESIKTLTGISNVGDAWKSIFGGITDSSIISIKVNPINSALPTNPEFVNCIVNGLAQMEFGSVNYKKNNIIIWDRSDGDLSSSGYTIYDGNDPDTVRCFGTNHSGVGYDYGYPLNVNGVTSYPSRILNIMSDYVIDAAILKTLGISTVTMCLKNHYGSINNPGSLHSNQCNPYIPSLSQQIRDVITPNNIQKLFIIDALFGRYASSSNFNPKMLIMSFDTVACDYQGQNVINEERAVHGYNPVDAAHITTAAQSPYNLGTTDINLIEIVNPSGIEETKIIIPADGTLKVLPNPFRRQATITFSQPRVSTVYIDLIDTSGRIKTKIYSGQLSHGTHQIDYTIDKKFPSGTYFIRLYSCGNVRIKKVMILN